VLVTRYWSALCYCSPWSCRPHPTHPCSSTYANRPVRKDDESHFAAGQSFGHWSRCNHRSDESPTSVSGRQWRRRNPHPHAAAAAAAAASLARALFDALTDRLIDWLIDYWWVIDRDQNAPHPPTHVHLVIYTDVKLLRAFVFGCHQLRSQDFQRVGAPRGGSRN